MIMQKNITGYAKCIVAIVFSIVIFGGSAAQVEQDGGGEVTGFGSAHFGSAEDVVDFGIRKEFAGSEMEQKIDDATGMRIKIVTVARLSPFNVPAKVIYRFEREANTLAQVDVIWNLDSGGRGSADSIKESISSLIKSYTKKDWNGGSEMSGYFLDHVKEGDPSRFIFFMGISAQKRMIALLGWPVYARKSKVGNALSADVSKIERVEATYQLNAMSRNVK
ncbi:hypothetical protein [Burkholderia ubonensis]|uniref:hypothetical protein n=1 Tax=Burkholderia ubonensis TaxID=101571 RepID=UPI000ADC2AC5|nr:hypothetical protein [Burkholderia ubonensis]